MNARYFSGEPKNLGAVSPLGCESFTDFVRNILGQPQILNMTREEFWAMEPKERDRKKRVRFVVPATFDETGKRVYAHAGPCNLIALDIDEEEEALRFYRSPQSLVELLSPFSFVAHTTAKSREEAPRIRIYVDAENIPTEQYGDAVAYIGRLLDVTVNKESRVAVQPMFLPTIFKGEDPMLYHPVFVKHLKGRPVRVEDISDISDEGGEKTDRDDYLEWLKEPMQDVTADDVREALAFLDPEMDFHKWTEIAMALKHQFRGDEAHTGYEIFDEWSAKAKTKYQGSDDTAAKWKNVKAITYGRNPITIRTLFHRAKEAGWFNERIPPRGLLERLETTAFALGNPPPVELWIFKIAGVEVSHSGNITAISAPIKSGKSNFIAAGIASVFVMEGDCLGWESDGNPDSKWVLHFDTEQSMGQHYGAVSRALSRAGVNSQPEKLRSWNVTGWSQKDALESVFVAISKYCQRGGIHSVWLDGIADLSSGPNEEKECFELIRRVYGETIRGSFPVICSLHFNPGGVKTRGHLGSELERKAETVLALSKKEEVITVESSGKTRGCPIPNGVRFAWCPLENWHISLPIEKELGKPGRKRKNDLTFLFVGEESLSRSELEEAFQQNGGNPNSFRKALQLSLKKGELIEDGEGYRLPTEEDIIL